MFHVKQSSLFLVVQKHSETSRNDRSHSGLLRQAFSRYFLIGNTPFVLRTHRGLRSMFTKVNISFMYYVHSPWLTNQKIKEKRSLSVVEMHQPHEILKSENELT